MKNYLDSTHFIDWKEPDVVSVAKELSRGATSAQEITRRSFEFVRDEIRHSWDYELNPVTCKASDVLRHRTGYCFAKSHLLAALLRANGVPAGMCYQRLATDDDPPFCLHGLNAVWLNNVGWYRVDPRGNKEGVNAQFCPPVEKLAFPVVSVGEAMLPEVWAQPLPLVTDVLTRCQTYQEVAANLPDVELSLANLPMRTDVLTDGGGPRDEAMS